MGVCFICDACHNSAMARLNVDPGDILSLWMTLKRSIRRWVAQFTGVGGGGPL